MSFEQRPLLQKLHAWLHAVLDRHRSHETCMDTLPNMLLFLTSSAGNSSSIADPGGYLDHPLPLMSLANSKPDMSAALGQLTLITSLCLSHTSSDEGESGLNTLQKKSIWFNDSPNFPGYNSDAVRSSPPKNGCSATSPITFT